MTESEIEATSNQIKERVRKKLFFYDPFISLILYKTNWKVCYHTPEGALAFVAFSSADSDELAGNNIMLSSKLFEESTFTDENYIFVLLHEIMHVISGHNTRRGSRSAFLWNLAGDHVINSFLKHMSLEEGKNFCPPDVTSIDPETKEKVVTPGWEAIFIDKDLYEQHSNLTVEEVYDHLVKENKDRFEVSPIDNSESNSDESNEDSKSDNNNDDQSKKQKWVKVTDKKTGKSYVIDVKNPDQNDINKEKDVRSEVRERFRSTQQRGNIPNFIKEYLNKVLEVKLPWTEILSNALKANMCILPAGRGWKRLHKNFIAHGLTLPGLDYQEQNNAIGTLVISIDTSGSISSDDLKRFASVVKNALPLFEKTIVLTHDVEIHQEEEFFQEDEFKFIEFLTKTGLEGRGGTSHNYVFKRIEELSDELDNGISMYIGLTDGYSDIENIWEKYNWSKKNYIPTYFIITKDGRIIDSFKQTINNVDQQNPRQIKIEE